MTAARQHPRAGRTNPNHVRCKNRRPGLKIYYRPSLAAGKWNQFARFHAVGSILQVCCGGSWIGDVRIDITQLAMTLIRHRLQSAFGDAVKFKVIGAPVSMPDAKALAEQDPWQFQWWALGLVGARPVEQKKGGDKGIDGRIY